MSIDEKAEALQYFGKKAFQRLFSLFKVKIESLGTVSGTVKIEPTVEEKKAIDSWMGTKIKTSPVTISLTKFEKRLIGSRFESYSLLELVELVTSEPIIYKKDMELQLEAKKQNYFSYLLEQNPHPNAQLIIYKIINKEKGSTGFITSYNENDFASIEVILKAVSSFPKDGDFERLPIFAERITGNPHYFDKNKRIYQAIEMIMCEKDNRSYRSNLSAEEETNLLSLVNLDKDDLHSFVTCYGLQAYRDGKILQQWYWANQEESVQNIPLRSLRNIEYVKSVTGKKVFVLENSGVFSSIIDKLNGVYPIVCTHGNFKLSGMLLLDKLIKGGAEIYYSGDIDVNGILIAKHLKMKYKESIHFWRMGIDEYHASVSNVELSNTSLDRLELDKMDEFYEVVREMKTIKKAGYQESLLAQYISDIKKEKNED